MIVEDSRLARLELTSQLSALEEIDLVGEAENIEQALSLFEEHTPDLVFLDIDLPDGSGFEFLTQLAQAPYVIFTTAFDQFAIKAFEQGAVDYLLKPFTQKRLVEAWQKFKQQADATNNQQKTNEKLQLESQFFVKDGQQCWLVTLSQVTRFEAMGNYTRVYFDDNKPMVYRTLAQIEERLPQELFFRVSRQNIVKLSAITHVEPCGSGGLELTLNNGDKVEVSRRQASNFKQLLTL